LIDYYTGIDAVLLTGVKCSLPIQRPPSETKVILGLIQKKLDKVQFMPQVPASDTIEEFLRNDLNKFIETVGLKEKGGRKEKKISDIPDEVLYKILTLLDLRSLYNASQVNRRFYRLSKDPLLYTEVNLKMYWHRANGKLLKSLHNRCLLIKKLDLSSCGYFGTITSEDFMAFMKLNGQTITNIRMNSAQFMNR
jgi:F-box and leucine-rich repeat protein 4